MAHIDYDATSGRTSPRRQPVALEVSSPRGPSHHPSPYVVVLPPSPAQWRPASVQPSSALATPFRPAPYTAHGPPQASAPMTRSDASGSAGGVGGLGRGLVALNLKPQRASQPAPWFR